MKTYKALDIANFFIKLASETSENDLTNLKLQKLLYFAQLEFLKKEKEKLFDDKIEAWTFGPVVRTVYNTFKQCGAFPITNFDIKYSSDDLDAKTENFIKNIWENYGKFSANHLVGLTHQKGSPWDKAFSSGMEEIDISKE